VLTPRTGLTRRVLAALDASPSRIPVLVVTAQGPEHFHRDDSWPSFTRHLSKPVEMTELINVVAELVRSDAS